MVCGDVCKGEDVEKASCLTTHRNKFVFLFTETAALGARGMTDPPQSISYELLKSSFGGFHFCDILQKLGRQSLHIYRTLFLLYITIPPPQKKLDGEANWKTPIKYQILDRRGDPSSNFI